MKTISLISTGTQSFALDGLSADGRYVLYDDNNFGEAAGSQSHLYLKDSQTGQLQLLATSDPNADFDGDAVLSQDGEFVAYDGYTSAPFAETISLFDRVTGDTRVVFSDTTSASTSGLTTVAGISADDQSVFFVSSEPDLPGSSGRYDLFQLNVQTGAVQRLLVDTQVTTDGEYLAVASGGRYIAASADDGSGGDALYRIDLTTGDIDVIASGFNISSTQSALSADGRFAVFDSDGEVYLKDFSTGDLRVVSTTASGAAMDGFDPSISSDGSKVIFETDASLLTPGATGYIVVSKDLATGAVTLLMDAEELSAQDVVPDVSADGNTLAVDTAYPLTGANDNQINVYLLHFTQPVLTVNAIDGDDFVNAADGSNITVSGTSDAIGSTVLVSLPDEPGLSSTAVVQANGTWSTTIDVSGLAEGTVQVDATVTDGLTTTVDHSFTIDRTPPSLTLDSVAGDNIINAAELTHAIVSGTVLDADLTNNGTGVGKLAISLDGANSATFNTPAATSPADGAFAEDFDASGVTDGEHTITLTATDPAGNTATVTKTILVDTTPPKITITSVSGDDVVDSTEAKSMQGVHGTSDAIGATVDVLIDGVEAGQAVVQADGTWLTTVSFASTITGEHDVTANVSDEAGNVGRADAGVYVDRGFSVQELSVGPNGQQGVGQGVLFPSLSADGTKLVFTGLNFNLMSTATGSSGAQVYIKNLTTGAISFATPNSSNNSELGAISQDGTKIVFVSNAPLDPVNQATDGDGPGYYTYEENLSDGVPHIRVFDSQTPDNFDPGSALPAGQHLAQPLPVFPLAIANNGYNSEFVETTNVQSGAVQLFENIEVDGSVNASGQPTAPYNQLEMLTPSPLPAIGTFQAYAPQFSADGSVAAIEVNLHAEQPSTEPPGANFQIYAGSTATTSFGHIPLASSDSNGNPMPFGAVDPALSANGKFVAFWSWDGAGNLEAYRKNLTTGELDVVSSDVSGNAGVNNASGTFTGGFNTIAISADGRYVAFTSDSVLTSDDSGTGADLFVKDMQTGAIERLGLPAGTFANDLSTQLAMRADGQYIAFVTSAALSPSDNNQTSDIYGVSLASFGTPPQIAIDAVADDDRINASEMSKNLAVAGTSDAIGQSVTLVVDGYALPGTGIVVGADGTWSTTIDATELIDGVHQLRATVTGTDGASATDGDLVTVDTVAPTVTLSADNTQLAPDQTATVTASFSEGIGNLAADFMSASGGTLSDPEFVNDHTLTEVFTPTSGATAYTVDVNSGGFFDYAGNPNISGASLELGETTSPPIISAGQSAVIAPGQASIGVIVESGGTMVVSSGGTSVDTTVSTGGTMIVQPGGFADPTIVSSGGTEIVSATGSDLGAQVLGGGVQIVYGAVSGVTISSGGYQYIGSSGDTGGIASATMVDSGSYAAVGPGGTFVGLIDNGGTDFVAGTASNTTVDSGSMEQVSADGQTLGATISGGGVLELYGSASGTMVDSAGYQLVLSGGSASGTVLSNGFTFAAIGAVLSNTQDSANGADELGGTAVGTLIDPGSYELTLDVGASISTVISAGGNETDYGLVSASTVSGGGYEFIGSGGIAVDTAVDSAGYLFIDSDGTAASTTLQSGYAYANIGAVLSNTTDEGGGDDVAGTAIGTVNSTGASELVLPGGTTLDATAANGGIEDIGGSGSGINVQAGAYELVTSGGVVSASVNSGGVVFVAAGATLNGTIDNGGIDEVVGTGSATVINSGGSEIVSGTAVGDIVSSGGAQLVYGTASNTTVAGGYELVVRGGSTVGATIADNGIIAVDSAASISGATISGGTLDLLSGAGVGSAPIAFASGGGGTLLILNDAMHFSGLVAGFTGTAEMDLTDLPYAAGVTTFNWSQTTNGAGANGTLTVSDAGNVANITLLGQYAQGNFAVQSGSFGGTLVTAQSVPGGAVTDPNQMQLAVRHNA